MAVKLTLQISGRGQTLADPRLGFFERRRAKSDRRRITQSSGTHAVIELAPDHATLVDQSDSGAMRVNGAAVKNCVLKDGDQITVGETTLVVGITHQEGKSTAQVDSHDRISLKSLVPPTMPPNVAGPEAVAEMRDARARAASDDSAVIYRSARRERSRKIITGTIIIAVCVFVVAVIIKAVGSGEGKREVWLREHNQLKVPQVAGQPEEPKPTPPSP